MCCAKGWPLDTLQGPGQAGDAGFALQALVNQRSSGSRSVEQHGVARFNWGTMCGGEWNYEVMLKDIICLPDK